MYVGIDIGSSFVKSAVLDTEKFAVGEIRKIAVPGFVPNPNPLVRENDPNAILDAVRRLIDWNVSKHNSIEGVLFSTQMHGFVLMDEAGNSITNYVTWQDERSTEAMNRSGQTYLDAVKLLLDADDVRKSGMPIKPSLATCNLYHWMQHHQPDRPCWFSTLGDYVIARLSHEKPSCHMTNAASTGLVDIEAEDWSSNVTGKLGFDSLSFPPIIKEDVPCGVYETGGVRIPLYPAVGDQQASMHGIFLTAETDLAINMGTGSQLCVASGKPTYGDYETRPFFENRYLRVIPHLPAGRALSVLVGFIQDIGLKVYDTQMSTAAIWEKLDACIEEVAETDAEKDLDVNISFFQTAVVPNDGAIRGINERNFTVGSLFYGAFENMARNYYNLHHKLLLGETQIERILCTGGLAERNPLLKRIIGEKFNLPCSAVPYSGDALAGLLRLARGNSAT